MMDTIRPYTPVDHAQCLALFDGNTPRFFAHDERRDFDEFLARRAVAWKYQVIERSGRIVACGGHAIGDDGKTAELCWGMVAKDLHGAGLGRQLTAARLRALASAPGVTCVRINTSQHTQGFYARFGFRMERIVADGYGPGLDRWEMLLRFGSTA